MLVDFSVARARRDAANRDRQVRKLKLALASNRPVIRKSKYLRLDSPNQIRGIDQTKIAAESLVREKTTLEWLEHKHVTVPKVLNYFKDEGNGQVYLLLSVIDGLPAQRVTDLSKQEILHLAAEAMKQFHSINFQGGENLRTLEQDLIHIQVIINLKLIKRSKFRAANNGKNPEEVYAYLRQLQYKFSEDVIVHGDYCLPNIIIAENNFGFIDVGDCGPGDPYKDFSAMEVSIIRNFGKELIDQFGYHLDVEKYRQAIRQSV